MKFEFALSIKKGQFFWDNNQCGSKYIMVAEHPIINDGISVEFIAISVDPLDQLVVQNKYIFVASSMHYASKLGDQPLYKDRKRTELYDSAKLKDILLEQISSFQYL